MQIPQNVIHYYVGIVLITIFAVRSFRSYQQTGNKMTLYFGIATCLYLASFILYAIPVLFSTQTQLLTVAFISGTYFELVALFFIWLALTRAYFPTKSIIRISIMLLVVIVMVLAGVYNYIDVIADPVVLTLNTSGQAILDYAFTLRFEIVFALLYSGYVVLSFKLLHQSRTAKLPSQKVRFSIMGIGFLLVGLVMMSLPVFGTGPIQPVQSYILAVGIGSIGIFAILTSIFQSHKS